MEMITGIDSILSSDFVMSGINFIGVDFICAALTLAYVAKLMFHTVSSANVIAASCCVAKVSLRDQHVARRVR